MASGPIPSRLHLELYSSPYEPLLNASARLFTRQPCICHTTGAAMSCIASAPQILCEPLQSHPPSHFNPHSPYSFILLAKRNLQRHRSGVGVPFPHYCKPACSPLDRPVMEPSPIKSPRNPGLHLKICHPCAPPDQQMQPAFIAGRDIG